MSDVVAGPGAPRWRRVGDVAAIGFLALVAAGLVVGSIPLRNGRVQDCGAPLVFSLTGRLDRYPAADGTVPGPDGPVELGEDEIRAAYDERCSTRVGDRMATVAGIALAAAILGVLAGLGFLIDLLKGLPRRPTSPEADGGATPPDGPPRDETADGTSATPADQPGRAL